MKKILLASLILAASSASAQVGDHYVNGYEKQDGTYVEPHYQTNPDHNAYDNYSTKGNENPYTGKEGTVNPDTVRENQNAPFMR